ncbi:hypothetical protein [Terrimonas pollutisoli]|uniref:hypothetical protein n=1 Tax=Terrimonas pollutisoli TaxID=3034147 RepID=UPI0023EC72B7|nr:hypothetical protein [Terrimonas sp. H1YJ31]
MKIKRKVFSFTTLLSAVKRLSDEERQLLRMQLFAPDALNEMKAFEAQLKKKKLLVKKTDAEAVGLTTSIRRKKM